jgi:putative flippase GtrA
MDNKKEEKTAVIDEKAKKAEKKAKHKESKFLEVVRFVFTGLLCTVIDLACQMGVLFLLKQNLSSIPNWGRYVSTVIAVAVGFLISTIVNFTLSRLWVFQNVDEKKNYNTQKYFWVYAGLGFGGFLLGLGLQELGVYICRTAWAIDLTLDPFADNVWGNLFNEGGIPFWAYVGVFCLKTIVTLIYNYFTRKKIIFKEPKKVGLVDEAANNVNSTVINLTYSEKSEVFGGEKEEKQPESQEEAPKAEEKVEEEAKEEAPEETIDVVYCKPQFNWGKPITKEGARDIIYSSLEIYDPRKTSVADVNKAKEMIVDEIYKEEKDAKEKRLKGK